MENQPIFKLGAETVSSFDLTFQYLRGNKLTREKGYAKVILIDSEFKDITNKKLIHEILVSPQIQQLNAVDSEKYTGIYFHDVTNKKPKGRPTTITPVNENDDDEEEFDAISFKEFAKKIKEKPGDKNMQLKDKMTAQEYIDAFWKQESFPEYYYGVQFSNSLFNENIKHFNIKELGTSIESSMRNALMCGVNETMIIIGTPGSIFLWHDEDGGSAAINYLHEGPPKIWIIINPSSTKKFERIIREIYSEFDASFSTCENPLKHKTYMTDLKFLEENNIEYDVVIQEAGTYMILWPNVPVIIWVSIFRKRKISSLQIGLKPINPASHVHVA